MSDWTAPGWLVDRLRDNLKRERIPLEAGDLERILEKGMLRTAFAFEALEREIAHDGMPDFLAAPVDGAAAAAPPTRTSPAASPAPDTIVAIAARIRAGEVSPVELAERSLAAIAERDAELNAFQLVTREQALAAARDAEREIAAGRHRGPLHGVPVAVKDLLDMAGTPTTAGAKLRERHIAESDATAVARLRAAGAVIVGKTRLAEFAYSPGSNNSSYGPTRNPRDVTRDTGGSSSGSGAAVAAGMVVAALGTDTGGSIRIPASLCGVVGLKPTYGRASLAGAIPLAWSLDHLGPMTRSVTDAAIVLEVLAGRDDADPRTSSAAAPAWSQMVDGGVTGLRVGVLGNDGEDAPLGTREVDAACRAAHDALARAGATLVPVDLPILADVRVVNGALIAMEAAAWHTPQLRKHAAEYGEFARARLLSAFAYPRGAYLSAQRERAELRRQVESACGSIDVLCMPAMPGPAPPLGVPASTRYSAPFNLLGWPAISVPMGVTAEGLPLGFQIVGRRWDEVPMLRAARVVEASRSA
ncbi:MAG TPA: amidase [Candidatus Eisenbacteria bacterium]|nr:amidase [Candidatus Eisenbacteria bacterium]